MMYPERCKVDRIETRGSSVIHVDAADDIGDTALTIIDKYGSGTRVIMDATQSVELAAALLVIRTGRPIATQPIPPAYGVQEYTSPESAWETPDDDTARWCQGTHCGQTGPCGLETVHGGHVWPGP